MVRASTLALASLLLGGPAAALKTKDADPRCDAKNRVEAARQFEKEYNRNFRAKVINQSRALENETQIVTVGEKRFVPFFQNFVSKLENAILRERQHTQNIVHAALDQESLEACQNTKPESNFLTLQCVDLQGWIPASVLASDMHKGSCAHNFFSWARPFVLNSVVIGSRKGAVFVDYDVVPYRHLVPALEMDALKHQDESVQMVTSRMKSGAVSTGIVWAKKWSVGILKQWLIDATEMINMKLPDQAALQKQFFTKPELKEMHYTLSTMLVGTCIAKGSMATQYVCDQKKALKEEKTVMAAAGSLVPGDDEITQTIAIMKHAKDWVE